MPDDLDLQNAKETTPNIAPVSEPEPLTGKEKAGVSLTWGIIGVLVGFLVVILIIFTWGESRYFNAFDQLETIKATSQALTTEQLQKIDALSTSYATQRTEFRAFWFDTLQLILLNVLFPTLTALLGYVFGTSKNNNS
ncbi:hypothetical protein [Photobacterium galatheae]|uniref:Uncharacterized protein n=1 Tax=Photobacterium galatheae TaxID=1654360 RepID=A0A066RW85_9GAMM|nr:hypothetical protein [Photobacterium galatheae]KDM93376.1 hypothetical protein EA58_00455 [Photobacterium galatheae]MCM0146956.1 hypothetical protein [Photobacterium galatheae]